jgi:hypothetical protein
MAYELTQVADALDALRPSAAKFDHTLAVGGEHAETGCIAGRIRNEPHAAILVIAASVRSGRSVDATCCCMMDTTSKDSVALR